MARVTIVDVAKAAGVSTSTASVALRGEPGVSDATRERVVAHAARLGYRVDHRARLLRDRRSRAVGVTFRPAQSFHADLVEALHAEAATQGIDLVLSAVTDTRDADTAVESLLRDRCSALVLLSPEVEAADLDMWGRQVPTVVLGSPLRAERVDVVATDETAGVSLAVDHLVGLGHHDILHVDGGGGVMSAVRADAYRHGVKAHGLRPYVSPGGTTEDAGITAAERILSTHVRPTAVLAYNDMVALGLLLTLRAAHVDVPGDVAVVGYDDTRTARLSTIGLTSVSQDPRALAVAALSAVAHRLDHPHADAQHVTTRPHLAIRTTTVPAAPTPAHD